MDQPAAPHRLAFMERLLQRIEHEARMRRPAHPPAGSERLSLTINVRSSVRDVTFGEDASQVRSGSAPQAMAELRNASLTLIRRSGHKPRPAREVFAARPWAAIRVVMTS